MITIPRETCINLDRALTREWLVTNGRGSYASSTILGANTRRYHGLLVAALKPPLGRTVMVAKVDEELEVGGQKISLGVNEWESRAINPNGNLYLAYVQLDGMIPAFVYRAASFELTKTIWMEYGRQTTYVRYALGQDSTPLTLTLLPFCTYRDFHVETHGALDWRFQVEPCENGCRVTALADAQPYRLLLDRAGNFTPLNLWYWRYFHRVEAERGLDAVEDLYLPAQFRVQLNPGEAVTLILTTEPDELVDRNANDSNAHTQARAQSLTVNTRDEFEQQLVLAADQFLVTRDVGQGETIQSVIAGYHWFGDWGRDTMITLEGLTLTTQRHDIARGILKGFSQFVSQGMLPNRFPDYGETPEYNTVDATLWYFHALARYLQATNDTALLRELFPILQDIVQWHLKGTRYNIHVDPNDGLIYAGEKGYALTWMDARVDDWATTPRIGKPVEISALWYNALRWMEKWATQLGDASFDYRALADRVANSFARFWFAGAGYLYDVLDAPDGSNDSSLRPNQLIALSLDHSPVPEQYARSILQIVERELLTPFGLRTLSPRHPSFIDHYSGDRHARDAAYHQGIVWTWLLGPYADAKMKFDASNADWKDFFGRLEQHLGEAGVGSISEIFEPFEPYRAVGCIAQAWSVAEVLRVYQKTKA